MLLDRCLHLQHLTKELCRRLQGLAFCCVTHGSYKDHEESQCFKNITAGVCKHAQKVPDNLMQGLEGNTRVMHNLDSENTLIVGLLVWTGNAICIGTTPQCTQMVVTCNAEVVRS